MQTPNVKIRDILHQTPNKIKEKVVPERTQDSKRFNFERYINTLTVLCGVQKRSWDYN